MLRVRQLLIHESFVYRRLSSDAPEAFLADQYERLTIDGSFGETVGEHGQGVEPIEFVDPPGLEVLAHGQRV